MRLHSPETWVLEGIESLEPRAWDILRSSSNHLVVAGPGAGKTELLAQRAAFLLKTGICSDPRRILAISFKKDSADNLRSRVASRCGSDLSSRFDSHTFDSFAKSLLDRFRSGLPTGFSIPGDYDIRFDSDDELAERVTAALRNLRSQSLDKKSNRILYMSGQGYLQSQMYADSLRNIRSGGSISQYIAANVWEFLLRQEPCFITFDMLKMLSRLVIDENPYIAKALRLTYSHVFLDEYQDTTPIQFDLLSGIFRRDDSVITAVGDNKQRIMLWAGAMSNAFDVFQSTYDATRIQLLINYRSDARLVEMQHSIVQAIDADCGKSVAADINATGEGICEILTFSSEETEAEYVASLVHTMVNEGVKPREICILSRQKPGIYIEQLQFRLRAVGVDCRLEEPYQDLLRDELISSILSFWRLALQIDVASAWMACLNLKLELEALAIGVDGAAQDLEQRLNEFIAKWRTHMVWPVSGQAITVKLVQELLNFLEIKALKNRFPQYRNQKIFSRVLKNFSNLLYESCSRSMSWKDSIKDFEGVNSVPAMTVHKSKGLEYHAVIFMGLEDSAWRNFARNSDEELCTFFVAFSRAKKVVNFTFCNSRLLASQKIRRVQSRSEISSLYNILRQAGVEEVHIA